jgi:hypothetical protein
MQLAGLTIQWWYEHGRRNMADAVDHTLSTLKHLICDGAQPDASDLRSSVLAKP